MSNARIREGSTSIVGDGSARRSAPTALLARAVVAAALALAAVPGPAQAQESAGEVLAERDAAALDCGDFATRRGAQAIFERSPVSLGGGDPFELDEDADGKACEAATPGGDAEDGTELGAEAGGDLDCVDLPSQAATQARLKADPSDPHGLDPDNNGIACEIVPVFYENPTLDTVPVAKARLEVDLDCEDFEYQHEAQAVLEMDRSDPNGLDGANEPAEKDERYVGNGFACETMPSLASNAVQMVAMENAGAENANAPGALNPLGLVAAWPRGGGLGLALDLASLLLVACGALALLTVWRGTRRSSGGSGR